MAGKSIEEARTAQRAASDKPQSRSNRNATTQNANVSRTRTIPPTTAEPSKSSNTVTFNGKCYMLVSDSNVATAHANEHQRQYRPHGSVDS